MTLGELVRKGREDKGWDQTELALAAGYSQPAISDIEAGRTIAPRSWRKLAAALEIEEDKFRRAMMEAARGSGRINVADYLYQLSRLESAELPHSKAAVKAATIHMRNALAQGLVELPDMEKPEVDVPPNATVTGPVERPDPNSIPVYGRAKGGDGGKYEFNGDVIGWEPRPAKLRGISGVYAVYIDGESMYPRYKAGETVVAQPGRPIAKGDDVIVQLAPDDESESPYGFVKEFVRYTPTKLILSQFNPVREIEFERDKVVSVHRIVHADR